MRLSTSILCIALFAGPIGAAESNAAALARWREINQQVIDAYLPGLRARLPVLYRTGQAVADTLKSLEETELALAQRSRPFAIELRAQSAGLAQVRSALLPGQALLELRQFRTADFKSGRLGEMRIAGLVIRPSGTPVVADLGPVSQAIAHWSALEVVGGEDTERTAGALYRSLHQSAKANGEPLAFFLAVYCALAGVDGGSCADRPTGAFRPRFRSLGAVLLS